MEKGIEIAVKEVPGIVCFYAGTRAKDGKVVTYGGRVLVGYFKGDILEDALALATRVWMPSTLKARISEGTLRIGESFDFVICSR
jgi:phosphoribosylamine-glycine ligase